MTYEKAKELFKELNIELSPKQFNDFCTYEKLLLDWNEKVNLTAITNDEEIWLKHFVDSCTINKYINVEDSIVDVGTGAGFPSIPNIIINPSIKPTLLDSLNKRINILKDICGKLDIKNADFVHGRAEDFGKDIKYREKYDVATARAVANLSALCEYCLPFVKVGGTFICMKAGNCEEELESAKEAIKTLGGNIESVEKCVLPKSDIERAIIIIRKVVETPQKYPRNSNTIAKNPL